MIDKKWNKKEKQILHWFSMQREKFFGFLDSHQVNLVKYLQIPEM